MTKKAKLELSQFVGFEWDAANDTKNWCKHKVSMGECEEAFFNAPLLLFADEAHSGIEDRCYLLGRTNKGRRLFVVFTGRGNRIRIISARDMSRAERKAYDA